MATLEEEQALDDLMRSLSSGASARTATEVPVGGQSGSILQSIAEGRISEPSSSFYEPEPVVAKKATPLFTNVQSVKDANPNAIFIRDEPSKALLGKSNTSTSTDIANNLFAGLTDQMASISKLDNALEKETALSNLKGSVAETSAKLANETRLMAEGMAGLPQLEQALKRAEGLDRADPLWNQHLVDSKETATIRRQVTSAQEKSGTLAKRLMLENPVVAGMAARLEGFIKTQESLIKSDILRSDKRNELIEQELLTLGPETPKFLTYVMPEVANDPRKAAEVKLAVRTDPNKKDLALFFSPNFTEEDILPASFLGNKAAQNVAIKLQADKTGQSLDVIKKNLGNANQFVNNEGFFLDQMKKISGVDPSFREAMSNYSKLSLSKGSSTDKQKFMARLDLVNAWTSKQQSAKTLGDVGSWTGDVSLRSNPNIAASMDKLQTLKPGPISMEVLVKDYVGSAPRAERAARLEEIRSAMTSHINRNNKGLFGSMDLISMNKRLEMAHGFSSSNFDAAMKLAPLPMQIPLMEIRNLLNKGIK